MGFDCILLNFSYLSHVGKCLGHGIITRGRFVLRNNRKAFDACVIRSVNFYLSIQCCRRLVHDIPTVCYSLAYTVIKKKKRVLIQVDV